MSFSLKKASRIFCKQTRILLFVFGSRAIHTMENSDNREGKKVNLEILWKYTLNKS